MLLHGLSSPHALSVLSDPPPERLIPLLENHKSLVEQKLLEKQTIIAFAKDLLREKKIDSQLKLNKFKISTTFHEGDYVFCKDNSYTPGASRVLRTTFSHDPYVVLKVKPTSLVLQRLADGFTTIYNKNFVKKYTPLDATFSDIPVAVRDVLVHSFHSLQRPHFDKLRAHAPFQLPSGNILDYSFLSDQDVSLIDDQNISIDPSLGFPLVPTNQPLLHDSQSGATLATPPVLATQPQDLRLHNNILVPGPLAPPEPKITRTKPSDPSTRILRSASRPNRSPQHSDSGSDSDDALPRRVQFVS